jgi:hypothetical protein
VTLIFLIRDHPRLSAAGFCRISVISVDQWSDFALPVKGLFFSWRDLAMGLRLSAQGRIWSLTLMSKANSFTEYSMADGSPHLWLGGMTRSAF